MLFIRFFIVPIMLAFLSPTERREATAAPVSLRAVAVKNRALRSLLPLTSCAAQWFMSACASALSVCSAERRR